VYECEGVWPTEVHALGLPGLDDVQLGCVSELLGAFLRHALPTEALPLEASILFPRAQRAGQTDVG
jgi:hypothetical protein